MKKSEKKKPNWGGKMRICDCSYCKNVCYPYKIPDDVSISFWTKNPKICYQLHKEEKIGYKVKFNQITKKYKRLPSLDKNTWCYEEKEGLLIIHEDRDLKGVSPSHNRRKGEKRRK